MLKFSRQSFLFALGVVIILALLLLLFSSYHSIKLFENYLIYFNLFTIGLGTYSMHLHYTNNKQSQKNNLNNL